MAARPVITLAVLQEMLQAEEPSVVLESFEMTAGSGRGDNYTAMVYRVALQGRQDGAEWRGSIICKVLPTSARRRDAYKSDALFRNEVAFYTRALPALQRFEARRGQADAEAGATASCTAAVPRCFRAQDNLVVLEDLRTRGFTMVDRRQGLGEKQLRTVLSRVARFHGLSLAMKALQPEEFNREVVGSIRETQFLASNEGWYGGYYRTINKHVLNMVHDGLPEGEERARCLAAASAFLLEGEGETASFFKRMVSLVQPVEPLAVLCHGDCWTSNFMFRYDDKGHLEDEVMLVDYQMSRYASPCLDLMLLLYSCTDRPVREARMDALLRHYHATLLDTMHRLGCTEADYAQPDVLWDMLTSEMHRLGRFGLGQAVDYVPCLCCESEEAPNVYDGQGDDEDLKDGDGSPSGAVVQGPAPIIIENERCVRMLADLVQELVAKGDL